MFFGNFNLPGTLWSSVRHGLTFSGIGNNKAYLIGDQFISMDFLQLNTILNRSGSCLDLCFSNARTVVIEEAPDSLVSCDSYHPPLSLKYNFPILLTIVEDKHSFRDFKNADYNSIAKSLSSNDWILIFNHQSADISTSLVQNSIIDSIHRFVPLKTFHRSSFLIWVSPKLNSLLFKKKTAHKKYKITGAIQDYDVFSCLRSQCKVESKLCLRAYTNHSQA